MSIWPQTWTAPDDVLPGLPADEKSLRRWQNSLDALEDEAGAALGLSERAPSAVDGIAGWAPPADLGPLPQVLLDRARSLAALQERAVTMLTDSRAVVEQEMAELARPRRHVQPVYMDVTG